MFSQIKFFAHLERKKQRYDPLLWSYLVFLPEECC